MHLGWDTIRKHGFTIDGETNSIYLAKETLGQAHFRATDISIILHKRHVISHCRLTGHFGNSTESERNAVAGMGWRESVARRSLRHGFSPFLPYQFWRKKLCREFGHFVVRWRKFIRFGQLVIEWNQKSQTGQRCPDGRLNMGESLTVRVAPGWRDIRVPSSKKLGKLCSPRGETHRSLMFSFRHGKQELRFHGRRPAMVRTSPLPLVRFYIWTRIVRRARPDWRFKRRKEYKIIPVARYACSTPLVKKLLIRKQD
jgi:hypothetical protein